MNRAIRVASSASETAGPVGDGSRVTVEDLETKQREVYALTLGEFVEGGEDGGEMLVSVASPLGQALLGRKVKDKVEIVLPMGKRRLKVVQLATVHDVAEGK
jgi:transcription elongation factor GreA